MLKIKRLIVLPCAIAVLAACAVTREDSLTLDEEVLERGYVIGEQVRRIQNYRLNGWSYLDQQHLILESGVSDRYLVSLRSPCYELRGAITIGFTNTIGNLTDRDRLIVGTRGSLNETCLIDSLHALVKLKNPADPR
jgi:hypothetical protein